MAKERKIDLVILGLLTHEDLTGYDIKKRIDRGISFFWKGSFGSIYPALNAMEKAGLVQKRMADDCGRREKILYHITDQGTDTLKVWLKEEQVTNDLKYETLLKLYFGGAEDRKIVSVKSRGGLYSSSGYERMNRGFHRLPSSRCESMGVPEFMPGSSIDRQEVS